MDTVGMVTGTVRRFLRLEGLAAMVLAIALYHRSGASWALFAALFLLPDLSMLGYLANPSLGANIYNAVHTYTVPLSLAFLAIAAGLPGLVPFALIWTAHIAMDRALGYGLKYPSAFNLTHLGSIGRLGKDSPAS